MGKRGISPLIATVVLIAFAVSLGAVVMNLGSGISKGSTSFTEQKECISMKLQFHNLNGPQVTFGGQGAEGFIEFVIDNVGSDDVTRLRLLVIGERQGSPQTYTDDINAAVAAGFTLSKRVKYDYNLNGQPKQVQVIPIALRDGKPINCNNAAASYVVP